MCKAIEDMKMDVRNEVIVKAVSMLKKLNLSKEAVTQQIIEAYSLADEEAVALVDSRW